jgi:hypothetical protein
MRAQKKRRLEKLGFFNDYLRSCEKNVGRIVDNKDYSDEVSNGIKENIIGKE